MHKIEKMQMQSTKVCGVYSLTANKGQKPEQKILSNQK